MRNFNDSESIEGLRSQLQRAHRRIAELEAEAEYRAQDGRYRVLFDSAPLGYQSLDEAGTLIEVNDAWCSVFGYQKEEVLGRNFAEFLHTDFRSHFRENFPRFKSMGYILGVEFEMLRKDGTEIVVTFDGKIGYRPDGSFRQTHCILHDITERKKAENERAELESHVRQAQKLESLGLLAGGIAHDFNNLLVGILGNAEVALLEMPSDSLASESVKGIAKAARQCAELANQMLIYAGRSQAVLSYI